MLHGERLHGSLAVKYDSEDMLSVFLVADDGLTYWVSHLRTTTANWGSCELKTVPYHAYPCQRISTYVQEEYRMSRQQYSHTKRW